MLTGDMAIPHGEAYMRGIRLRSHPRRIQKMIGYCPQVNTLLEDLTGAETLEIFGLLRGVRFSDITKIIKQISIDFKIEEQLKQTLRKYSGGCERKLSAAIALLGNPVVLYLGKFSNFYQIY